MSTRLLPSLSLEVFLLSSDSHASSRSRFAFSARSVCSASSHARGSLAASTMKMRSSRTTIGSLPRLRHGTLTCTSPNVAPTTRTGIAASASATSTASAFTASPRSLMSPFHTDRRKLSASMPSTNDPSTLSRTSATADVSHIRRRAHARRRGVLLPGAARGGWRPRPTEKTRLLHDFSPFFIPFGFPLTTGFKTARLLRFCHQSAARYSYDHGTTATRHCTARAHTTAPERRT